MRWVPYSTLERGYGIQYIFRQILYISCEELLRDDDYLSIFRIPLEHVYKCEANVDFLPPSQTHSTVCVEGLKAKKKQNESKLYTTFLPEHISR